jgi:retron-type reverse transcriptase
MGDRVDFYARLRTRHVLHLAWAKVRDSGRKPSSSKKTKKLIDQFEADYLRNLEKIWKQLKREEFAFTGEKGVALPKGKSKQGKRPLVIAPVENRIVRRAILEVLQGYGGKMDKPRHKWAGVPAVREITMVPTSVGGVSERGVPHGLALVDQAVRDGKHWFARSDIKSFFTRIPRNDINRFIRNAVADKRFTDLFEQALATNLENEEELEERNLFKLFPDHDIGVAQGSALSALAGNIALRDFDAKMNDRGIVCIRYIDDFVLLGSSEAKAQAAYRSARKILIDMEMDIYDLSDGKARQQGKADSGNIHDGTVFLGYRISGNARQPCAEALEKFMAKLDDIVTAAKCEMKAAAAGTSSSHKLRYHQSMVQIHKVVWGWSQSFRHTTTRHVFAQLDKEIDKRIATLDREVLRYNPTSDPVARRRVFGVHLLADTESYELPETQHS